ncbi:hypothetical protein ABID22_003003 [Pontibacter aydingkolensis]
MANSQSINFRIPFPICLADAITVTITCVLLVRESFNMDRERHFLYFADAQQLVAALKNQCKRHPLML